METSAPTLIVYHAVSRTGGRCGDKIENAEEDALRGQEVRKVIAFSSVIHSVFSLPTQAGIPSGCRNRMSC